jgi:sortase A
VGAWLIAAGVIVLLFVAYQLWGTGIRAAQAQNRLEDQFAERLALAGVTTTTPPSTTVPASISADTTTTSSAPVTTTTVAEPVVLPPTQEGDALARIEIPKIGLDDIVVAGVKVEDLRKGPGHFPDTPLPGEIGNVGIAGHRTTWGAPFQQVDELEQGDEIVLTNLLGMRFVYRVTETLIVKPSDVWVVDPTTDAQLTLTSCHPEYSARERIVIKAVLDETVTPALGTTTIGSYLTTPETLQPDSQDPGVTVAPETTLPGAPETTAPAAGSTTTAVPAVPQTELLTAGWFSDRAAFGPAAFWVAICSAIAFVAWRLGRAWRRWPAYLVALPIFAVALFLCFEQINRLLPQNI